MFTDLQTADDARPAGARAEIGHDITPHHALLEDLAADPTDLLDLAALRGVAFRTLVTDILSTRGGTVAELIRNLGPPRTAIPQPEPPPFVWVRVLPLRGVGATLGAGWLTAVTVDTIVAHARRAGHGSRIEIIVPLDSGEAAARQVRALCAGITADIPVRVRAQGEDGGSGMNPSSNDARTPHGNRHESTRPRETTTIATQPTGTTGGRAYDRGGRFQ